MLIPGTDGAAAVDGGIPYVFGGMVGGAGGGGEFCWADACPCCSIARILGGRFGTPVGAAVGAGGDPDTEAGGGIGCEE